MFLPLAIESCSRYFTWLLILAYLWRVGRPFPFLSAYFFLSFKNIRQIYTYRKSKKCQSTGSYKLGDLEAKGYSASLVTCEISSLCHYLSICRKSFHDFFPSVPRSSIRACLMLGQKLLYQPLSRYSWLSEI